MDAVALVNPILSGAPLVDEVRRRGLACICIINLPRAFFRPPLALPPAEGFDLQILDDRLEAVLASLASSPFRVRAVIAGAEAGVTLAEQLADRLGLRANDPELVGARRNKYDMKLAARRAGLACARAARCRTRDELDAFAAEVGFPLVLKTPEGAATVQVYRCADRAEAHLRLDEILERPNLFGARAEYALAEEYLAGPEYVVDTFSDESGVHVTDVWRYEKVDGPQGDNLYHDTVLEPADSAELAPLVELGRDLTRAVGIHYGPAHVEVKQTPRGPAMIEIAARPPGIRIPQVVGAVAGFDLYRATVEAYLDGRARYAWPVAPARWAWIAHCPVRRAGRVRRVLGVDAIRGLASYRWHHLALAPGDPVTPTGTLHDTPMSVWLIHEDRALLARDAAEVHRLFDVEVEPAPALDREIST